MYKRTNQRKAQVSGFLRNVVRRLKQHFKPNRIILFGSYANGTPVFDSDLDILVIKNTRLPFAERARRASKIIGRHILPIDLVVLTQKEINQRLKSFDPFLEETLNCGKVIYEKAWKSSF